MRRACDVDDGRAWDRGLVRSHCCLLSFVYFLGKLAPGVTGKERARGPLVLPCLFTLDTVIMRFEILSSLSDFGSAAHTGHQRRGILPCLVY